MVGLHAMYARGEKAAASDQPGGGALHTVGAGHHVQASWLVPRSSDRSNSAWIRLSAQPRHCWVNPPPVPPECGDSASTGLLAGMRRQEQYDEEAARREPLLGGDGGDPDGGGGASRRQSGEEAGFSRGLSPGRGLSPDRVVSSTPGGAIRLTKRASTVDRVRGKAVAGRWHALGSSEMLVQKQCRCGAVRVRPTPTMTLVWQPAWHAWFQGLWGQWHSPPACRCNRPAAAIALCRSLHPLPVRTRAVRRSTKVWC